MTNQFQKDDLSAARYALELFLLGGEFEIYEDGRLVSAISPDQTAAELSYGKLILSCWGEGWSKSWRIIGCRATPDRLSLECTRQMGLARSTLDLRRGPDSDRGGMSRREYCKKLAALVESALAGLTVKHAIVARDDQRNVSGSYARLIMTHGNMGDSVDGRKGVIAGLGASPAEHQTVVDRMLGAGIVWADQLGRTGRSVDRLFLFVPAGRALTLATRLTSISQDKVKVSLYEVDERAGSIVFVEPFDQGDLAENFGKSARRAIWPDKNALPAAIRSLVESIVQIAPRVYRSPHKGRLGCSIHTRSAGGESDNRREARPLRT